MPKQRTFVVEGLRTGFPLDMLRYDSCWPWGTADAINIQNMLDPSLRAAMPRSVRIKLATSEAASPCAARWESFGWRVVEDDR